LKLDGLTLTPPGTFSTLQKAVELNPLAGTRVTVKLWLPPAVKVSELAERLSEKLGGVPPPPPPVTPEEVFPPQLTSVYKAAKQTETRIVRQRNALDLSIDFKAEDSVLFCHQPTNSATDRCRNFPIPFQNSANNEPRQEFAWSAPPCQDLM
jgi:hypothetical protein